MAESMVASYLAGINLLRRSVGGLSRDQLLARPVAGKWSMLEVVCHLVDSEQAWVHRMKRVIAEDRPLLIGYDESKFTAALDYHARELEPELALFEATRREMAAILERLPAQAWERKGVHSESGMMTLRQMVQVETDHVPHHLAEIELKRRALVLPDLDGSRDA